MKPGGRFPYVTTETLQMCFNFVFSDGKMMLCLSRKSRIISRVLVTDTRKPRVRPVVPLKQKREGSCGTRSQETKAASLGWPEVHLDFSVTSYGKKNLKEPFGQSYRF